LLVPLVTKQDRREFDAGAVLRDGFLAKLEKDARKYLAAGIREQVLLSFTTDPFHPRDTTPTRRTLEILATHGGLGFCTLTKGGLERCAILISFVPTATPLPRP
jgi:hypothetical protein